jgi:hypothetical protein
VVNLLAVWQAHQLAPVLIECWRAGVVLTGVSAGSVCWFTGGTTDSFGLPLRAVTNGLKPSATPNPPAPGTSLGKRTGPSTNNPYQPGSCRVSNRPESGSAHPSARMRQVRPARSSTGGAA